MKFRNMSMLLLTALFAIGEGHLLPAQDTPPDARRAMRRMLLYDEYPITGTYKLNVVKSKFNPGPALKSGTVRIEMQDKGLKCVLDPVDSQGATRHGEWSAQYDGKDYPANMKPFADSIVLTKINEDAFVAVYKRAMKVILGEVLIFSQDRKILTMTQLEIAPTGLGFHNTLVYDRQ